MYRIIYITVLSALLASPGCRPRSTSTGSTDTTTTDLVTLNGTLRLTGDTSKLPDVGGDVHLFLYSGGSEGYCAQANGIFAQATQLARTPSKQQLVDGLDYEVRFEEPPGQTYPVTLYLVADWQQTRERVHECETVGGVESHDALAFYGVTGAALAGPETSACCHFVPQAITLGAAGTTLDAIDLVFTVRPGVRCADPLERGDACYLRKNPDGSDTACATALGADKDKVLVAREGEACP
jgi:hypothetical protein